MHIKEQKELFAQAKQWTLDAGLMIRKNLNKPLSVTTKSNHKDLVTTMDEQVEKFFATNIKQKYPEHQILSEEGFGDQVTNLSGFVWIIDPIDGTMNFVHQKRNFAISLAIYYDNVGYIGIIYDVMADEFYYALKGEGAFKNDVKLPPLAKDIVLSETVLGLNHSWLMDNSFVHEKYMQQLIRKIRGSRTYGSAALQFAYVAEGSIDGYLSMRLAPWDFAAGKILVNEVGGLTTNIYGESLNLLNRSTVFTGNRHIQQTILNDYLKTK
ncbi:MAG TPA: inositol monophosphatase family protein [Bacillota bacterium]|nr:inositol monophosphatase family protein [Bacillota bacterium]